MVVYLVTSIFETEPGQFKKYTMAYDSLDAALEYVELDMTAQYDGIYAGVLTDDIKELIRMRGDFFFKYGELPHYIMIERLDVHSALPENVDNVVRFSLSEHMIEPVETEKETEKETEAEYDEMTEPEPEPEPEPEMEQEFEEEEISDEENESDESPSNNIPIVESSEANMEESSEANMEESTIGMNDESALNTLPPSNKNNSLSADSVVKPPSGSNIAGLDEEEEMPMPETMTLDSESNMGNNMPPSNESNMGSNMPSSTESNIPAALRSATGGKQKGKRSTRRKGGKGAHKSRKA